MSLHLEMLSRFRANQSLLFFLSILSREATNTHFIVFGLTQPVLEPTIYHTRGVQSNQFYYTTDAVEVYYKRKYIRQHIINVLVCAIYMTANIYMYIYSTAGLLLRFSFY